MDTLVSMMTIHMKTWPTVANKWLGNFNCKGLKILSLDDLLIRISLDTHWIIQYKLDGHRSRALVRR